MPLAKQSADQFSAKAVRGVALPGGKSARLIPHDELLDALSETYVQPQVLRTYMLDLRKALGDDPACPRFIQTLPKRGYCFVAPVKDAGVADSAAASSSEAEPAVFDGVVGREQELARLKTMAQALASGQRQTASSPVPE